MAKPEQPTRPTRTTTPLPRELRAMAQVDRILQQFDTLEERERILDWNEQRLQEQFELRDNPSLPDPLEDPVSQ